MTRLLLSLTALCALATPSFAQEKVDFARDVLPILSDNCFKCHGPDEKARRADLRLDRKESVLRKEEPIIVPGNLAASELIHRITTKNTSELMPPSKSNRKLTSQQIDVLRRWVEQGAL